MNPTLTKLEKRVNKLERMLEEIIETYDADASIHLPNRLDAKIAKAKTLLGITK